jgi:formylglycine-generating enzyme required for sulfatase activity/CheY-like chemotaxis protein
MRILLVDDEAGVLQAHMEILKTIPGHEVRVAANAAKALEHAAALGGVDLLVADVVMEPVDGFTLRDELQALYPAMQTIFISGYDLSEHAERFRGAPFLAKPVDADALRSAIAAVDQKFTPVGAVPVAVPAVAAAAPVVPAVRAAVPVAATPRAVPAAAVVPAAVAPTPVAAAAPAVARPAVRAVPQPSAAAVAAAVPAAVPAARPAAVPAGAPRAAAAAAPAAVPQAMVVPLSTAMSPEALAEAAKNDTIIGVQLGDYRVQELLGISEFGREYAATQLSVKRRVGLSTLSIEKSGDEQSRARFLADARAKAAVQHPFIVSVFEADESNGLVFYTHEFLDGASMEDRLRRGEPLDERIALQVVKAAAEGLQYLWSQNISHGRLGPADLRVGDDNIARLANIACSQPNPAVNAQDEIRTVSAIIQQVVPAKSLSPGFRALLGRMAGGANAITSWPLVAQAVKALEPKVVPVEAAKIKAADAAAMRAVEAARRSKRNALYISIGTLSVLIVVMGFVIWKYLISAARKLDAQVLIPAGSYLVGSPDQSGKAELGAYEIDQYEVTIGDYAKFVAWCEKNPDREHEFDHPRGERRLSHVNDEVKILIQNAFVRGRRVFKQEAVPAKKIQADPGAEIDPNSPMVAVSYWDAYAYARWRGKIIENGAPRDLPTEEEWEAAARGPKGFKYPWGDKLELGNFNSNTGYKPLQPGGAKTNDAYNYWAPVDQFRDDRSDFKVMGMAGNVCEWVYRKEGNREIPLLKGGSFASDPVAMWDRILKIPAEDAWFCWPAAARPKGTIIQTGTTPKFFVGDDVTPSFRSLYAGFRTVKRK